MAVRRRGVALVLVLLTVAAIVPVAIQAGLETRSATIEAIALRQDAADRHAAHSAAALALNALVVGGLTETDGGDADTTAPLEDPDDLLEMPALLRALIGDALLDADELEMPGTTDQTTTRGAGGSRKTIRLQRHLPVEPIVTTIDGVEWHVTVRDIATFLAINHADEDQLDRFLDSHDIPSATRAEIIDQFLDWRDDDDFVRPLGMEASAHRAAGIEPVNGPIRSIRELLYLPAMDHATFDRIAPELTLIGDGSVNAFQAPRALLQSIPGIDDFAADRLIELRNAGQLDRDAARTVLGPTSDALDRLRFAPAGVVRLTVRKSDGTGAAYHGWASAAGPRVAGPFLEPAGVVGQPTAR